MSRIRALFLAVAVAVGLVCVVPATAYQRPGVRAQIDLTSAGKEPAARGIVGTTSLSGDGRVVAFDSDANDLVPGDDNQAGDVFVRDTAANTLDLISRGTNGLPGVGVSSCAGICWGSPPRYLVSGTPNPDVGSWDPSISRDGRYVAFTSTDVNLVSPPRSVGVANIYVFDRRTGRMTLASAGLNGAQSNGGSFLPSLSANGRYVSFSSDASNLVPGDTNGIPDVFVRDLVTGKTTRVSVGTGDVQSCNNVACAAGAANTVAALITQQYPESSISGDGRYVEFSDAACNLVTPDANCEAGVPDVFVHDRKLGTTVRISVDPTGAQATYPLPDSSALTGAAGYVGSTLAGPNDPEYYATGKTISDDGRYAAFASTADDLVPNNTSWDPANPVLSGVGIYVRDLRLGRTYRVDVQSDGQPARGNASNGAFDPDVLYPSISADGRYVAMFCSNCVQLKPTSNLQVYDLATGATTPIPCPVGTNRPGSAGKWNCDWAPQISADGRHVSFTTYWTPNTLLSNYVASADAFTWDRGPAVGAGSLVHVAGTGPNVLGATLAYRPERNDMFVREDVRTIPSIAGRPLGSGLAYAFDLTAVGRRYEVRATGASFGLFCYEHGTWSRSAVLPGGFGTTGTDIVFAVPLSDLGLRSGDAVTGLRISSGVVAPL